MKVKTFVSDYVLTIAKSPKPLISKSDAVFCDSIFLNTLALKTLTDEELAEVVRKINNRPRKCFGFRSPHEVFNAAKSAALAA